MKRKIVKSVMHIFSLFACFLLMALQPLSAQNKDGPGDPGGDKDFGSHRDVGNSQKSNGSRGQDIGRKRDSFDRNFGPRKSDGFGNRDTFKKERETGSGSKGKSKQSNDNFSSNSESAKKEYVSYMGERKMPSNEDLEPTKARVVCTNREEEVAQIDIAFNQCINPLSIENNSILINGNPLPENAEIVFNRSGDTLSIKLSKDKLLNVSENVDGKEKIKIEVFNIQSFDGKISKEEVEAYF